MRWITNSGVRDPYTSQTHRSEQNRWRDRKSWSLERDTFVFRKTVSSRDLSEEAWHGSPWDLEHEEIYRLDSIIIIMSPKWRTRYIYGSLTLSPLHFAFVFSLITNGSYGTNEQQSSLSKEHTQILVLHGHFSVLRITIINVSTLRIPGKRRKDDFSRTRSFFRLHECTEPTEAPCPFVLQSLSSFRLRFDLSTVSKQRNTFRFPFNN